MERKNFTAPLKKEPRPMLLESRSPHKKHQALRNDAWRSKKGVKKIMIAYKRLV
jgi:hypothetical protein